MVALITHQRLPLRFVLVITFNCFVIATLCFFWIWANGHDGGVISAPDYSMKIVHQSPDGNIFVFEQVNPATDVLERCLSHGQIKPPADDDTNDSPLPVPHTVESCVDVEHQERLTLAYVRMLFGAFYLLDNVNRVLVFGLGAGSFPIAFYSLVPHPERVDIVEIDQSIVQAATNWFGFKPSDKTHIFVQDGAEFVTRTVPAFYDLIVVDAYDTEGQIPTSISSLEFLTNLHRALRPGGVAAINLYNNTAVQLDRFRQRMKKAEFSHVYELVDKENVVLLAVAAIDSEGNRNPLQDIKKRTRTLKAPFEAINIDSVWLLDKFKLSHTNF